MSTWGELSFFFIVTFHGLAFLNVFIFSFISSWSAMSMVLCKSWGKYVWNCCDKLSESAMKEESMAKIMRIHWLGGLLSTFSSFYPIYLVFWREPWRIWMPRNWPIPRVIRIVSIKAFYHLDPVYQQLCKKGKSK